MNPYERRILHTAIQEVEGVTSRSIGVDQNRRVVLEPEGGVTNTGSDRERYNRGSRGGRRGGNRSAGSKPAAAPRQTGQTCPSSARSKCRKRRSPLRKQPLLHLRRNKSKYQRRNRRATTAPPFLYFAWRYIIIGINNILGFVKTENVGSDPHIGRGRAGACSRVNCTQCKRHEAPNASAFGRNSPGDCFVASA